ncbi:hypothetical protein CW304_00850 [Bacillus sp. UFRGS-B20]|nr:hypothetical protein CW304_00850 [Bacillus sp. UFRGS-B20]
MLRILFSKNRTLCFIFVFLKNKIFLSIPPHHLHLLLEVGVLSKGMIENCNFNKRGAFIPAYSYADYIKNIHLF